MNRRDLIKGLFAGSALLAVSGPKAVSKVVEEVSRNPYEYLRQYMDVEQRPDCNWVYQVRFFAADSTNCLYFQAFHVEDINDVDGILKQAHFAFQRQKKTCDGDLRLITRKEVSELR